MTALSEKGYGNSGSNIRRLQYYDFDELPWQQCNTRVGVTLAPTCGPDSSQIRFVNGQIPNLIKLSLIAHDTERCCVAVCETTALQQQQQIGDDVTDYSSVIGISSTLTKNSIVSSSKLSSSASTWSVSIPA